MLFKFPTQGGCLLSQASTSCVFLGGWRIALSTKLLFFTKKTRVFFYTFAAQYLFCAQILTYFMFTLTLAIEEKNIVYIFQNNTPLEVVSHPTSEQMPLQHALEDLEKRSHLELQKITVQISDSRFLLLPNIFFDENRKKELLNIVADSYADEEIYADELGAMKAKNIFPLAQKSIETIKKIFPNAHIKHIATSLLEGFGRISEQNVGKKVIIFIKEQSLYIGFYDGTTAAPVLFNSYSCHGAMDFLYYVLAIYQQFELSQQTIPLYVTGEIVAQSSVHHLFQQYIADVRLLTPAAHQHEMAFLHFDLFQNI